MSLTIAVFDLHGHPEDNFRRFDWLGRMILEEKPDSVVIGGDIARMDSLSRHGDSPATTLREDLAAMQEGLSRIFSPLRDWNARRKDSKHAQHAMRTVWLEGNHEERARRVAKEDPHGFASLVDWDDPYSLAHWYDERYEYGQYANVGGVLYTHVPRNMMGRAMSHTAAAKHSESHLIYGHSHTLQTTPVALHGNGNGVKMVLSAPAYMEKQNKEPYAKNLTTGWVYGLLRVRPSGSPSIPFSYDYLSMDDMERLYG